MNKHEIKSELFECTYPKSFGEAYITKLLERDKKIKFILDVTDELLAEIIKKEES